MNLTESHSQMGKGKQNKITIDVAADSSSLESLSFAGLASIQDQPKKLRLNNTKQDQDFEFDSTVRDPIQSSPADILISNGQLLPHAFLLQSKTQAELGNQSQFRGSSLRTHTNSKRSDQKNKGRPGYSAEANQGKENKAKEKKVGFRLFQSFLSPCRTCHATEPTVRVKNIPGEK